MLQWRYAMENVLFVPPGVLRPAAPGGQRGGAHGAAGAAARSVDEGLLSEMVQVAFSQRRKLLRHTLGKWLEQKGFGGSFDVQRRAEEVPVAEYLGAVGADRTLPF